MIRKEGRIMLDGKRRQQQKQCVLVSLSHYTLIAIPACLLCFQTEYIPQPQVHSWHFPFFTFISPLLCFQVSNFLTSSHSLTSTTTSLSLTLMDAKSTEVAPEPLKYQTWFLKVSIHCEGCRRKVKKVLRSIDGVFTTTIDPQQQKVTVTGSVGIETLIRKLVKAGKHAEIWPENLAGNGKTSGKSKKKNEQRDPENHSVANAESNLSSGKNRGIESTADNCNGESKSSDSKTGDNSPEKSPASNEAPEPDHKGGQSGGGGSGKKKKKKVESGGSGSNGLSSAANSALAHTGSHFQSAGQVNLIPTRQPSDPYPEIYYPPLVYLATYNRLCPMGRIGGPSYYVPPLPYLCANLDQDPYYQFQSTPLVSFEIFSDENANGCSIM